MNCGDRFEGYKKQNNSHHRYGWGIVNKIDFKSGISLTEEELELLRNTGINIGDIMSVLEQNKSEYILENFKELESNLEWCIDNIKNSKVENWNKKRFYD